MARPRVEALTPVYIPHFNAMEDEAEIRRLVATVGTAQFVTVGADGYPRATLLPVLWHGDRVIAHMARANDHWRGIASGSPVLLVCFGPDAYISPSWYASKREHGKVVPTWNYSAVHLSGRATVHDDPEWVRSAVTELTTEHEHAREHPWAVSDAPDRYVEGQLRAIVGIEVAVDRVEGKAKLSQNRSEADQDGVIAGLRAEPDDPAHHGAAAVAAEMARVLHR